MNYQQVGTMMEVDTKILTFNEFFRKVKQHLLEKIELSIEAWNEKDKDLYSALLACKSEVHKALCNNFNTSDSIEAMMKLVHKANIYFSSGDMKKATILHAISLYIKNILGIFGLNIGSDDSSAASGSKEEVLYPYVQILANFRKRVREIAKNNEPNVSYLSLCDEIRDHVLPAVGVKIVDDGDFDFFFGSPESLKEEVKQGLIKKKTACFKQKTTRT